MNGSILSKRKTYVLKRVLHYDILIQFPVSGTRTLLMQCPLTGDLCSSWKKHWQWLQKSARHTQSKEYVLFVLMMLCVQVNKPHEAQYMFAWVQLFPKFSKAKEKSKLQRKWKTLSLSGGLCGCHINMCSLFLRNSHYYIISSSCS